MKINEYGRSMIEMIGVLTIIGALSVGGVSGYNKMLNKSRVNKSIEQISAVSGQLSTIGANGGNYAGLNNNVAIKLKAVLQDMISGGSLKNPFGGAITISNSTMANSGDDLAYYIKYDGLSHESCMMLATHDWGSTKNSSLIAVVAGSNVSSNSINSAVLKCSGSQFNLSSATACNGGDTVGIPMPVSEAAEACSDCRSSNSCSVAVKYY